MRLRTGSTARWSRRPRTDPREILVSNSKGTLASCCANAIGAHNVRLATALKPSANARQARLTGKVVLIVRPRYLRQPIPERKGALVQGVCDTDKHGGTLSAIHNIGSMITG